MNLFDDIAGMEWGECLNLSNSMIQATRWGYSVFIDVGAPNERVESAQLPIEAVTKVIEGMREGDSFRLADGVGIHRPSSPENARLPWQLVTSRGIGKGTATFACTANAAAEMAQLLIRDNPWLCTSEMVADDRAWADFMDFVEGSNLSECGRLRLQIGDPRDPDEEDSDPEGRWKLLDI